MGFAVGKVCGVLPHALRLRKLLDGHATEEFYVVPRSQVPQSVFANLESVGLVFRFQVSNEPCGEEAAGEARASSIQPVEPCGAAGAADAEHAGNQGEAADGQGSREGQDGQSAKFPPPLPHITGLTTTNDWQQVVRHGALAVKECLQSLGNMLDVARLGADGGRVCDVLFCCAAGAHVLLDCQAWWAHFGKQLFPLTVAEAQGALVLTLRLLAGCLSDLDACGAAVRNRVRGVLQFCQETFQQQSWPPELMAAWRRVCQFQLGSLRPRPAIGEAADKRTRTPQKLCSAPGCGGKSCRLMLKADAQGPAQWRCKAHREKLLCNVPGCARHKVSRVHQADVYGLAGHRCCVHGARRCSIASCFRFAYFRAHRADEFGPPGARCRAHCTKSCNVRGCDRVPIGVCKADHLGQAGSRCSFHGCGCRVLGCTKAPWGKAGADDLGPAGRACWVHGGRSCSVSGCMGRPLYFRPADGLGPAGTRCKQHGKMAPCFGPKKQRLMRRSRQLLPVLPDSERCCYSDGRKWRCAGRRHSVSTYCLRHLTQYQDRLRLLQERKAKRRVQLQGADWKT